MLEDLIPISREAHGFSRTRLWFYWRILEVHPSTYLAEKLDLALRAENMFVSKLYTVHVACIV